VVASDRWRADAFWQGFHRAHLVLKHAAPDVYHAAYKFLEPKDYLNARLTGRCAATPDSITLHWVTDNRRIDHIDYDRRLLPALDREKLPDLCRAIDILGPIRAEIADDWVCRTIFR
jgi:xylulokinase